MNPKTFERFDKKPTMSDADKLLLEAGRRVDYMKISELRKMSDKELEQYIPINKTKYIENKGDVLACKYYHLTDLNGADAICNAGIKEVDGKQWEVFWVSKETETAYYGTPAEGLGLVDCMILKEDTRNFLPEEIEELEKHYYQLGSIVQKVEINPVKSKWIRSDYMNEEEIIIDAKQYVNNIKEMLNDGKNNMTEQENIDFYTLQCVIQRFIRPIPKRKE